MSAPENKVSFSKEFQRLQRIEQCIIGAVDAAGSVTEELSKFGATSDNKQHVEQLCRAFLEQIKQAQDLLHDVAATPATDSSFETTVYQSMAMAHLASEKVAVVSQHIQGLRDALTQHSRSRQGEQPQQQQQQQGQQQQQQQQ